MERILRIFLMLLSCLFLTSCSGILADLGLSSDIREEKAGQEKDLLADDGCDTEDGCADGKTNTNFRKFGNSMNSDRHIPSLRDRIREAIESNDVVVGMTRSEVIDSWGEPSVREVAGSGSSGHERWTYGTRNSIRGEQYLIFENGKVVGWHR